MRSGISSTFTVFMIKETPIGIIGNAGVETAVRTEKNIDKPGRIHA